MQRVHGKEEADRQVRVADAAFSGAPISDPDVLDVLYGSIESSSFRTADLPSSALDLAVGSNFVPSRSEARRLISQGGYSINGERIASPDAPLPNLVGGQYLVQRQGKKRVQIVRVSDKLD